MTSALSLWMTTSCNFADTMLNFPRCSLLPVVAVAVLTAVQGEMCEIKKKKRPFLPPDFYSCVCVCVCVSRPPLKKNALTYSLCMKLTGLEVVERLQLCLQVGTLMKMRCSSTCFDDPNTHKQDIKDLFTVSLKPPSPLLLLLKL